MNQISWTREKILKKLREDAKDGIAPSSGEVPYGSAAAKRFGSWQNACDAAGLKSRSEVMGRDIEQYMKWDRETLIEQLREDAENGIAPPARFASYRPAAERVFGSWIEACEAAGLERVDNSKHWTREKMIRQLREDAVEGIAPDTERVGYVNTARRLFGSWEKACRAADLEPKGSTKS